MSNIEVHITANPDQNADKPTIVFGFAGEGFSQAVILTAPEDPTEAVKNADVIYKAYIDACGTAVKEWKNAHTKKDETA